MVRVEGLTLLESPKLNNIHTLYAAAVFLIQIFSKWGLQCVSVLHSNVRWCPDPLHVRPEEGDIVRGEHVAMKPFTWNTLLFFYIVGWYSSPVIDKESSSLRSVSWSSYFCSLGAGL